MSSQLTQRTRLWRSLPVWRVELLYQVRFPKATVQRWSRVSSFLSRCSKIKLGFQAIEDKASELELGPRFVMVVRSGRERRIHIRLSTTQTAFHRQTAVLHQQMGRAIFRGSVGLGKLSGTTFRSMIDEPAASSSSKRTYESGLLKASFVSLSHQLLYLHLPCFPSAMWNPQLMRREGYMANVPQSVPKAGDRL